jgi:hypothetical protein
MKAVIALCCYECDIRSLLKEFTAVSFLKYDVLVFDN